MLAEVHDRVRFMTVCVSDLISNVTPFTRSQSTWKGLGVRSIHLKVATHENGALTQGSNKIKKGPIFFFTLSLSMRSGGKVHIHYGTNTSTRNTMKNLNKMNFPRHSSRVSEERDEYPNPQFAAAILGLESAPPTNKASWMRVINFHQVLGVSCCAGNTFGGLTFLILWTTNNDDLPPQHGAKK